nr:glycerophosphodiester phosphodiesterase family protein [Pseudoalteromonas luteoviolacea]
MRTINIPLTLFLILIALLLSACSSTKPTQKDPATIKQHYEATALREAIAARGFYQSHLGNINYANETQCGNYQLQSHRGSIRYPENSLNAVIDSLDNGFDVIEIDVRITSDDVWVLHHDSRTGRETGTIDNKRRKIERLNYRQEWGYLRTRDQKTGQLLEVLPPTLRDTLITFANSARAGQLLNIEIKSQTSKKELEQLDTLALQLLGHKRYFYSSLKLDQLIKMREVNSNVFLSYIQRPAKKSVMLLKKTLEHGAASDNIYQRNSELIEDIVGFGSRRFKENRHDNPQGMSKLKRHLKHNFGIAIDIRQYAEDATRIRKLVNANKLPVATYTINGHAFHAKQLSQLAVHTRPNSVIIDDTLYGFCTEYELPKMQAYQGTTAFTKILANLPADLDLERLNEVSTYYGNGLYPALNDTIKSIDGAATTHNYVPVILKTHAGPKQSETAVDLKTDKAVEVELRKTKSE